MPVTFEQALQAQMEVRHLLPEGVLSVGISREGDDFYLSVTLDRPKSPPIFDSVSGVPIRYRFGYRVESQ